MYRVLLLLSVTVLVISSCKSSEKQMDCERLKTGKYKLNSIKRDNYWIIERHDTVQLEINGKTGDTTLVKITWTSPCGYEMIITKSQRPATDTFMKRMERIPSVVKILSVTNDYYTFEAKKKGVPINFTDTIWIYHEQEATGIK